MPSKETYCIIKCRVSDDIQLKGGGLERQESACRHFAAEKGWVVDYVIRTPHSATTTERDDIDEEIAYIEQKKRKGINISFYIIQTIDRLTRVGTMEYFYLKGRLEEIGVQLVDVTGIIQPKRNTLAHLGEQYQYKWSVVSPSENSEIMAAQDGKAEATKILTRLVGAEIQLVQDGYAVRRAPDGLVNKKIQVGIKERVVRASGSRAHYFQKMFEWRAEGVEDIEICARLNASGFATSTYRKWDRSDKENPKVVGIRGGKSLTIKQLQRFIMQTEYAGVSCEEWNKHRPMKMRGFEGIVSVDVFNRANRGKVYITPDIYAKAKNGEPVEVLYNYSPWGRVKRMRDNPKYPWKCIPCSICGLEMLGSASKGKSGEKFEAYHCGGAKTGKRAHKYIRVRKADFEKSISVYLDSLCFEKGFLDGLELHLVAEYRKREQEIVQESSAVSLNVATLKAEQAKKLEAFNFAESAITRSLLERQIEELETRIKQAEATRNEVEFTEKSIKGFVRYVRHVMEHPAELLAEADNLHSRRGLLSLFFENIPTYAEILNGTPKLQPLFRLSEDFKQNKTQLVTLPGIEPGLTA